MAVAAVTVAISGCGVVSGPASPPVSQPPPPTSSPAANSLYVDHNGTFYEYRLPLSPGSKPMRTLTEWAGLGIAPVIAADQYGNVALGSPTELRFFKAPIVSFAPSRAKLRLTLTPAITEVGISGADLVDLEYDPNENLWLFNNLGAEISELRAPISQSSVAALTIGSRRARLQNGGLHCADARAFRRQRHALRLRKQLERARAAFQDRLSLREAAVDRRHQSRAIGVRRLQPVAAVGAQRAIAAVGTVLRTAPLAAAGGTAVAARQRDGAVSTAVQSIGRPLPRRTPQRHRRRASGRSKSGELLHARSIGRNVERLDVADDQQGERKSHDPLLSRSHELQQQIGAPLPCAVSSSFY